MTKKLHATLIAFLLLGIPLIFGSSLHASEPVMVTRDSSSTTFLGLNTGNMTLDDLLASVPGGLNFNGSGNVTAVNNGTFCQPLSGETNATMFTAVHVLPADGEVYSPETRQEESDSLSGSQMQLVLVLSLAALIFLFSQAAPQGKNPCARGIHR